MSESYNIDRVLNSTQLEKENVVVHMYQVFTYVRSESELETGFYLTKSCILGDSLSALSINYVTMMFMIKQV